MWDEVKDQDQAKGQETIYFSDWLKKILDQKIYQDKAEETFLSAERLASELKKYRHIPQTPPWHAEGFFVSDHIHRILTGFFYIIDHPQELLLIEEFARIKEFQEGIEEFGEVLQEYAGLLIAFILLHDFGKVDTISFSAKIGSLGEAEGFNHGNVDGRIDYFKKLVQKFGVDDAVNSESPLNFYEEYQIGVHYLHHARVSASDKYLPLREKIADSYRLSEKDRILLTFLIRYHIDVIQFFTNGPDQGKYYLLAERARKAGLDADLILSLQLIVLFLDTSVGSLHAKDGKLSANINIVLHMMRSEMRSLPKRAQERVERKRLKERKCMNRILEECGLRGEEFFRMINAPFGPKRKEIANDIREGIKGAKLNYDYGEEKENVQMRMKKARELFKKECL